MVLQRYQELWPPTASAGGIDTDGSKGTRLSSRERTANEGRSRDPRRCGHHPVRQSRTSQEPSDVAIRCHPRDGERKHPSPVITGHRTQGPIQQGILTLHVPRRHAPSPVGLLDEATKTPLGHRTGTPESAIVSISAQEASALP